MHPRFHLLDFLRGIAAISVVIYHFSLKVGMYGIMGHAYLAVDFFLVLSGFVIETSYSNRIKFGEMNFHQFSLARLIRLLPLVFIGTSMGAFFMSFASDKHTHMDYDSSIPLWYIMGIFLLPVLWEIGNHGIFPINRPLWSLFFEIISNIFHFFALRAQRRLRIYLTTMFICFIGLLYIVICQLTVDVGFNKETFLLGFPRVIFSYTLGAILANVNLRLPVLNAWQSGLIMALIFLIPGLTYIGFFSPFVDLLAITVINPLVVLSAAKNKTHYGRLSIVCIFGDVSYPLYTLHDPFVRVISTFLSARHLPSTINICVVVFSTFVIAAISYFVYLKIDNPVRSYLRGRFLSSLIAQKQTVLQKTRGP